jgi:L-threonylcarbamoyladenylate synthase
MSLHNQRADIPQVINIPIEEIDRAVELLRQGDVVALPTETVYGLAGDGFNPLALAKIFEIKQRPHFDPLILHVTDLDTVQSVARSIPKRARILAEKFWPGPLTLILPKQPSVPDLATSGLPTVAVRVPSHPISQALLKAFGGPLAAPSANRFGRISPTSAEAVRTELGSAVRLILDGGPCRVGVESTIVDCSDERERPLLLRAGGTPVEEIEALVGPLEHATPVSEKPLAPGHLAHHYAPQKPLRLIDSIGELSGSEDFRDAGLLAFDEAPELGFGKIAVMSQRGDLAEAAANFFAMLRSLDESPVRRLVAVRPPQRGLGVAINERLGRAQHVKRHEG